MVHGSGFHQYCPTVNSHTGSLLMTISGVLEKWIKMVRRGGGNPRAEMLFFNPRRSGVLREMEGHDPSTSLRFDTYPPAAPLGPTVSWGVFRLQTRSYRTTDYHIDWFLGPSFVDPKSLSSMWNRRVRGVMGHHSTPLPRLSQSGITVMSRDPDRDLVYALVGSDLWMTGWPKSRTSPT
jgi:hypothetical protein